MEEIQININNSNTKADTKAESKAETKAETKAESKEKKVKGFNDITPPSYTLAHDKRKEDDVIVNVDGLDFKVIPTSDPYILSEDSLPSKKDKCKFYLCRGPTYLFALLWSFIMAIGRCVTYLTCCLKTYYIMSDEELTDNFIHKWPLQAFIKKENDHYVYDASEFGKLKKDIYEEYNIDSVKAYWNDRLVLEKIEVGDTTYTPEDDKSTNAWSLAKYYVMYTAQIKIRFGTHANRHFPQNAATVMVNKLYDDSHIVNQLIKPHIQHMKSNDDNIINSPGSVINSEESVCCLWNLSAGPGDMIQGYLRETSRFYPPFLDKAPTPMLQNYYNTIFKFVTEIIAEAKLEDESQIAKRKLLFKWLKHYLGYPDLNENKTEDLVKVITYLIFTMSVLHSAEHYLYTTIPLEGFPMAVKGHISKRSFLPGACWYASFRLVGFWDSIKNVFYFNMFTRWWRNRLCCCLSDTRLLTTTYDFENNTELKKIAKAFREGLEEADTLTARTYPKYYFPLAHCARSIEF
jgi:hypothetical protein